MTEVFVEQPLALLGLLKILLADFRAVKIQVLQVPPNSLIHKMASDNPSRVKYL